MTEEPCNEPHCARSEPGIENTSTQPFDPAIEERFISLIARLAARQHIRLAADGANSIQAAPAAKPDRSRKRRMNQSAISDETPGTDTS